MKHYVLQRFLSLVPVLLGITFLSFALMRLAGSDAVQELYSNTGGVVSQEVIDAKRHELGLYDTGTVLLSPPMTEEPSPCHSSVIITVIRLLPIQTRWTKDRKR